MRLFLIVFCFLSPVLGIAQVNHATIAPNDSPAEILRKAANVRPSERQLRWQRLEITGFFHFGINTFTNREWGQGTEDPRLFNPTQLDADQWVATCQQAGIRQVILTAKHHDGFCLWPSQYTEHSVKNSPWKNGQGDVVREVSDACRKYGIGFGVYLSPWDRNAPMYGSEAYNTYFIQQLTELLTHYGRIDEVWFDGANGEGPNGKRQVYDFNRWYELIRRLQPDATIAIMGPDVRWVGTESGYGRDTEWSVLPLDAQMQEKVAANSQSDPTFVPNGDLTASDLGSREQLIGAKGLIWYPAETDVSIRPGWFYHPEEDDKVKTPEKLFDIYCSSVGKNSVLLLNLPPNQQGLLHPTDVHNLLEWKRLRDITFSKNKASGATLRSKQANELSNVLDGRDNTHATTQDSVLVLELKLKGPQQFDMLMLQENIEIGQRIEKFVLEYRDKGQWRLITEGTTVGYKRLLRFDPVITDKVRLRVLSSRLAPALSEIALYKLPEQVKYNHRLVEKTRILPTKNKATGRPTSLATPPSAQYSQGGSTAWNNGIFGSNHSFKDTEWLGWEGGDFEGVLDLQKTTTIRQVSIDVFNQPSSWIYIPAEVSLYTSMDGQSYSLIETRASLKTEEEGVQRVLFKCPKTRARYVKIVAKNHGVIPVGFPGAGAGAWLFVDEVMID